MKTLFEALVKDRNHMKILFLATVKDQNHLYK